VANEVLRLKEFGADELFKAPKAIELIKSGLKKLTRDEMKKVKEIVVQYHLKPSLKKPGLYALSEAKLEGD